ncbi:hypothetical protein M199_gp147 [Halogranum tailed virus 1]|uniref:Uncharacterized protein n=1 Tax=Halogranum tailed virus 1 TaxID=1273749 RepID=R4T718_9CAUD|nr:hypothetical protein M199_gp147 [Halogranum tailed virus 1]AGM11519.1 hypothetical protein HGTV1_222 [Halogranum tailed virus 1]
MTLESKDDVEKFLWSICQGGYDNYRSSSDHHRRIFAIRMMLKRHVDRDTYDTKCRAECRDGSPCHQMVKVYRKRCNHHVRLK